jgi:hypothetical protein
MAGREKYMTHVSLSPKDLYLVIEAMEHRLEWYDKKIQAVENEDLIGDLANDRSLLECILNVLKRAWRMQDAKGRRTLRSGSLGRVRPRSNGLLRNAAQERGGPLDDRLGICRRDG